MPGDIIADGRVARGVRVVRVEDAGAELLLAEGGRAPVEVEDLVCAMGDGLGGPQGDLFVRWQVAQAGMALEAADLLEHGEAAMRFKPTHEGQAVGGEVEWGRRIHIAPYRIVVEPGAVEVFIDLAQVDHGPVWRDRGVGGDPLFRAVAAPDDRRLLVYEAHAGIGAEAVVIEHKRRVVGWTALRPGLGYLGELGVGRTPEDRAPGLVEGGDADVSLGQPSMPGGPAVCADTAVRTLEAELVVDLPADDVGIGAEVRGNLLCDPERGRAIGRGVQAGLAAGTECLDASIGRHLYEARIFGVEPGRQGGGGGAEDYGDAVAG